MAAIMATVDSVTIPIMSIYAKLAQAITTQTTKWQMKKALKKSGHPFQYERA